MRKIYIEKYQRISTNKINIAPEKTSHKQRLFDGKPFETVLKNIFFECGRD